ncbi:trehalose-phosphatase [Methyloligella sp. 2.7D]|uniref:trehalose-phosphatase n=1 Tax=Methyloligella sp. 2.7D TaxID=3085160 RepID=UPI002FD9100C
MTSNAAFFIDFDGTLVAIAERPDLVVVEPRALELLKALYERFDGAVAIQTGRSLAVIDDFLKPLKLPVAAEHGSVRRDVSGEVHRGFAGKESIETAAERLAPVAEAHEGLLLERKESSIALHYRRRPELEGLCREAVSEALKGLAHVQLLEGKMVLEIKAEGLDKGRSLKAFMEEEPFKGRIPVMIGDDVTDEYGFDAANALGGLSIKIGDGETKAKYRTSREGFFAWAEDQAKG